LSATIQLIWALENETLSASASVKEARPSSSGTFTPAHPIHLVSKFCFTPATINQSTLCCQSVSGQMHSVLSPSTKESKQDVRSFLCRGVNSNAAAGSQLLLLHPSMSLAQ